MADLNQRWAGVIFAELAAAGVRHVVICPGSRSTPLALAAVGQPELRTWSVIDERSAAFFALGLAKGSGTPAAVLCTSGSAGAHFLPAAIEASEGHVPLVLITADRPWELQGFGAPQTIDQVGLFGRFVREAQTLPAPEASPAVEKHLRAVMRRLVSSALGPKRGPVHLNAPFREPLAPKEAHELQRASGPVMPPVRAAASAAQIAELTRKLEGVERGVVVCGPREADDGFGAAVHALGEALGFPVIAEAASNARFGFENAIATADVLLRSPKLAEALRPQLVLRFGGGLTTKVPQAWLDASQAHIVSVHDELAQFDPQHTAELVLCADAVALCRALLGAKTAVAPSWRATWKAVDQAARRSLIEHGGAFGEPTAARAVARGVPPGSPLVLSSSMPVRDVETFGGDVLGPMRVLSNRGVNGIDGVISTALGVAAGSLLPTTVLIGDVALLHDVGALVTAKRLGLPLTIVAVNNDGGGIFHFLPVAQATPHFETWFGTPHGVSLEAVAAVGGAKYVRVESAAELETLVASPNGLRLIEVRTERAANVVDHRERLARAVTAAEGALR